MFIDDNKKIILGSKSPRRQELVKQITSNIEVRIQDVDENFDDTMKPCHVPLYLAKLKAQALKDSLNDYEILITADTVVILEDVILGKPKDFLDAKSILKSLSGKRHNVITGCVLIHKSKEIGFTVTTEVYFKKLSENTIDYYIENFNPLDKAGAYGIQDWIGIVGIEKINGCYYNVMGLPVSKLIEKIQEF